ncbi:MAG TPA: exodeoxyribonuclease VII large subunit [Victivallales bacterium]|nr:exodeoxyribonuclease VII large subunit [Victivallales bacterium]
MHDKIWKISDVNSAVKEIIESTFTSFWIEAEIGTMTVHRSGHVYLNLKDSKSQLRAVLWKGASLVKSLKLETGSKIEAFGSISVYAVRGEYQFTIRNIRNTGLGTLQKQFEEIKLKLLNEGLFENERKKIIPVLPKTIGVVTSSTGAAIKDFLKVINRRFPNIHIQIFPASVQGENASKELIKGILFFNKSKLKPDVIVLTRGGGSMEDLWPFNSEILARTIAECTIPVISAVGHEIDFTISDFVADLRVATPSAAAELVIAKQDELKQSISNLKNKLKSNVELFKEKNKRRLERVSRSYVFSDPKRMLYDRQQIIDEMHSKINHLIEIKLEKQKNRLNATNSKLSALNPKSVLNRGYSILTEKKTKKIITSPNIASDTIINALLMKGSINLTVFKDDKITNGNTND